MTTTLADPFLVGYGPVTFSTSLELVRHYPMIWDVNGYYRELGVSPYATKLQIKWAYRKKKGWKSPRLTYIMKQLFNPAIRRLYDATPLGEVFWDAYIEEAVRQAAQRRASELMAQGRVDEAELVDYDSPFSEEILDIGVEEDQNVRTEPEWPWAYYLWQSSCQDKARLQRWQEALCGVLGDRKEHLEIAVGFAGDRGPWEVQTVGYRLVAFLGEGEQPSEATARAAASRIVEVAHEGRDH